MTSIVFENDGSIDLRAIKTFGVSAKEIENPIGYFGTGLKYAIAILMRENCMVELFTNGLKYEFKKKSFDMRGKAFEGISMNDDDLPFTTELGKNWQLWQAFRELYCNCSDESGKVSEAMFDDALQVDSQNKTFFKVTGDKFLECYRNREQIILNVNQGFLVGDGDCEVFDVPSRSVFYRGIRVMDLPAPAMFTYNLKCKIDLTEDRTVNDSARVMNELGIAIGKLTNKSLIRRALTASQDYAERNFSFNYLNYFNTGSEEFYEVLAQEYKSNNDRLNPTARDVYRKKMQSSAAKHYEPEALTNVESKQLERANKILTDVYPDFCEYKIIVVRTLGQETMALADVDERAMVVSKKTFELGTKFLVSTLLEEYTHLKTGFHDHSRQLQTHLFDSICSLIENYAIMEPI